MRPMLQPCRERVKEVSSRRKRRRASTPTHESHGCLIPEAYIAFSSEGARSPVPSRHAAPHWTHQTASELLEKVRPSSVIAEERGVTRARLGVMRPRFLTLACRGLPRRLWRRRGRAGCAFRCSFGCCWVCWWISKERVPRETCGCWATRGEQNENTGSDVNVR